MDRRITLEEATVLIRRAGMEPEPWLRRVVVDDDRMVDEASVDAYIITRGKAA